jgi:hypothetical protein
MKDMSTSERSGKANKKSEDEIPLRTYIRENISLVPILSQLYCFHPTSYVHNFEETAAQESQFGYFGVLFYYVLESGQPIAYSRPE